MAYYYFTFLLNLEFLIVLVLNQPFLDLISVPFFLGSLQEDSKGAPKSTLTLKTKETKTLKNQPILTPKSIL